MLRTLCKSSGRFARWAGAAACVLFFLVSIVDGQVRLTERLTDAEFATAHDTLAASENANASVAEPVPLSEEQLAPSPAALAAGVTLDELTSLAHGLSPVLREAAAEVRATRGRAYQAGLHPNPSLFTASPQWAGHSSQYTFFVGQEIVTGGKLRLNRQAVLREVRQAQSTYEQARFAMLTRVRSTFYRGLLAHARVDVLDDLVGLAEQSKHAADRLLAAGQTSRIDVLLLDVELEKRRVAHSSEQAVLTATLAELAAEVGDPELLLGRLLGDLSDLPPPNDPETLQAALVTQNSEIGAALAELSKNRVRLDRARAEPVPDLNLQGGYQYNVEGPRTDQGYAQLAIELPLWNRNQGGIREAQGQVAAARAKVGRVQNQLIARIAQALGKFNASTQIVNRYQEEILPNAAEALELTQNAYAQGEFDLAALLQAQRTLSEARLSYIDALAEAWQASVEIAGLVQMEEFP